MNYIFFGTPRFAEIVLENLINAGTPPRLVVSNPDRPVGRKKVITSPPTKVLAEKHGIVVWQPESLKIENWKLKIEELGGIDFCIVAAYSKIIPRSILDTLPAKFVGVHPSLLPKYRGPTPIQSAILAGEEKTGVTLFLVDKEVDHGPVLASQELVIADSDNYETLEEKLAELGGELLVETLPKYLRGEIKPQDQNHSQATFTKKFKTEDAEVKYDELKEAEEGDLEEAERIERMIRALNPEPGVWTIIEGKRVKLLRAVIKDGRLVLKTIQKEGKKPQNL